MGEEPDFIPKQTLGNGGARAPLHELPSACGQRDIWNFRAIRHLPKENKAWSSAFPSLLRVQRCANPEAPQLNAELSSCLRAPCRRFTREAGHSRCPVCRKGGQGARGGCGHPGVGFLVHADFGSTQSPGLHLRRGRWPSCVSPALVVRSFLKRAGLLSDRPGLLCLTLSATSPGPPLLLLVLWLKAWPGLLAPCRGPQGVRRHPSPPQCCLPCPGPERKEGRKERGVGQGSPGGEEQGGL